MDKKKQNLRPPTEEEIKEMFRGIVQESRDSAKRPTFPKPVLCNKCRHRVPATAKCSLLYPNGIPAEIIHSKVTCKEFKQK